MDYEAALFEACPVELAEAAKAEDLGAYPVNQILSQAWARQGADRPDCINAMIAYLTPKIGPSTEGQQRRNWLGYAAQYYGPLPEALRDDMELALARLLPYERDEAKVFFMPLIAHRFDLREALAATTIPDWTFGRLGGAGGGAHTWYYYRYLAIMGEDGAYEALRDKVANTVDGNAVMGFLDSLAGLRTPEARDILETYRDDPRSIFTASGVEEPMKDSVAVMLDLGPWDG